MATARCNGEAPRVSVMVTEAYPPGIFGWTKKCLYVMVLMLMVIVLINIALTIWIIKVLDIGNARLGSMEFTKSGIRVGNTVEFEDTLYAAEVSTFNDNPIKIDSSGNITLTAQDRNERTTNKFYLGTVGLHSQGPHFLVRDSKGGILFQVNPREVTVAAGGIHVQESGGTRLAGSLETRTITGSLHKDLKIESFQKRVKVKSKDEIKIESRAGRLSASSLTSIQLKTSKAGRITLDTSRLEIRNLPQSQAAKAHSSVPVVFQVCMCENGRLFFAPKDGVCRIKESFCSDPSNLHSVNN